MVNSIHYFLFLWYYFYRVNGMTAKDLEKLKKVELEILLEFDRVCKKHDIKYFISQGTCLGAVKFDGFIPWDDDIDINISRDDYNKFIQIQDKELDKSRFWFSSFETDETCFLPYGKLRRKGTGIYCSDFDDDDPQNVWIDVFPYDNVPNSKLLTEIQFFRVIFLKLKFQILFGLNPYSEGFIKKMVLGFIRFTTHFTTLEKCKKKLVKVQTKYNKKNTNKVSIYMYGNGNYGNKDIRPRYMVEELITHKFEGYDFYIPKHYDEYLTMLYGEWRKMPPKEKQHSDHHIGKVVIPDEVLKGK